jgi:hypothetical protein
MGDFEFLPFLIGAFIPGVSMLAVVVLALTRWRSSVLQLVLSVITLAYGIVYAHLILQRAAFSLGLALYGLPTLTGGLGLLVWVRSRFR